MNRCPCRLLQRWKMNCYWYGSYIRSRDRNRRCRTNEIERLSWRRRLLLRFKSSWSTSLCNWWNWLLYMGWPKLDQHQTNVSLRSSGNGSICVFRKRKGYWVMCWTSPKTCQWDKWGSWYQKTCNSSLMSFFSRSQIN